MLDVDVYALQRLTRAAGDLGHYNMAMLLAGAESLPRTDRDLVGQLTFQLFRPAYYLEPSPIDEALDQLSRARLARSAVGRSHRRSTRAIGRRRRTSISSALASTPNSGR